jgi:hypothetical protein
MRVTANVVRDGEWWAVEVPDFKGGFHTQAARLRDVPEMVADAVGMFDGVDPADVIVDVKHTLPPGVADAVERARVSREEATRKGAVASANARTAARAMAEAGLSAQDAAALLGVSRQRVAQLLAA